MAVRQDVRLRVGFYVAAKYPQISFPCSLLYTRMLRFCQMKRSCSLPIGLFEEVTISNPIPSIPAGVAVSHRPPMSSGCSVATVGSSREAPTRQVIQRRQIRRIRFIDAIGAVGTASD